MGRFRRTQSSGLPDTSGGKRFSLRAGALRAVPVSSHISKATFLPSYKRLVVQTMTVRPYEHADPYALLYCNQTSWADAIVRIWPTTTQAFWPPADILAANMLETFHKRCGTGAPIPQLRPIR